MNESPHQRQISIGVGLAVLATLIWSGNFIIARGGHKRYPSCYTCFLPLAIGNRYYSSFCLEIFYCRIKHCKIKCWFPPAGRCYRCHPVQHFCLYRRALFHGHQDGLAWNLHLPYSVSNFCQDLFKRKNNTAKDCRHDHLYYRRSFIVKQR